MALNILGNRSTTDTVSSGVTPEAMAAKNGHAAAITEVNDAIRALGMKYYNANKDNASAEFAAEVSAIKEAEALEKLWGQYELSLEGKRKCEKCGAIITSDSIFCNKCGVKVEVIDFSAIVPKPAAPMAEPKKMRFCTGCGKQLPDDAVFCESCGCKA